MTQPKDKLAQLQSTFSCPTNWEAMTGTNRKRFCNQCNKHVYDFSQMTRDEIEVVLEASRGNLCARVTRKADGSIQTLEHFSSTPHLIRRASPLASAVVSAILGLTPTLATNAAPLIPELVKISPAATSQKKVDGATASISGVVVDSQKAIIANATISLTSKTSGAEWVVKSNENGAYHFDNLPAGDYVMKAEAPGFKSFVREPQLLAGQQLTANFNLFGADNEGVVLGGAMGMPPQPLRIIFYRSGVVVDATVGKSVLVEKKEDHQRIKTALYVNEYFKGAVNEKVINFYHWDYEKEDSELNEGEQLLLFLKAEKDSPTEYVMSDYSRSIRKLSAEAFASYASRIHELAALTNNRKPEPAELVEWFVRCSIDPNTRWEGVSELQDGYRELQSCEKEKRQKAEEAKATAQGVIEELQSELDEDLTKEDRLTLQAIRQMTPQQKESLTQTLLGIEKFSKKDLPLFSLVSNWDRARVIPYLLSQLRKIEKTVSSDNIYLCHKLVNMLEDDDLTKMMSQFYEVDFDADKMMKSPHVSAERKEALKEKAIEAPAKRRALFESVLRSIELKLRLTGEQ